MATVLVADDDPILRQVLDFTLQRGGYEVLQAVDGLEALEITRRCRPDAVILDAMMPGLHGFEVCRQLKDDPATSAIPILIVTARAAVADRKRGLAAGAIAYVTKPFSPKELLAAIAAGLAACVQPARPTRVMA